MSPSRRSAAPEDALPPVALARALGSRSAVAREAVRALLEALVQSGRDKPGGTSADSGSSALRAWATLRGPAEERKGDRATEIADWLGMDPQDVPAEQALFALHSFAALVFKLVAWGLLALPASADGVSEAPVLPPRGADLHRWLERLERGARQATGQPQGLGTWLDPARFHWYLDAWSPALATPLAEVVAEVSRHLPALGAHAAAGPTDLLKPLVHALVPRRSRRRLGAHYTPDWLAAHVLGVLDFPDSATARLLDPACGSGTFLVHALHRILAQEPGAGRHRGIHRIGRLDPARRLREIAGRVCGADREPLAVLAARVNLLVALRDLLPPDCTPQALPSLLPEGVPVFCIDTLRCECDAETETETETVAPTPQRALGHRASARTPVTPSSPHSRLTSALASRAPFDVVAGNPPWVNWQTLPDSDRTRLLPLWSRYGLFPHQGFDALLGAANDDLAVLLSYAVTHRLLRPGGRLGFVLPQSVLKSAAAGQGFRRLRFGQGAEHAVRVDRVDDLSDLPVFGSGSVSCCVVYWTRGAETVFPVDYVLWRKRSGSSRRSPAPSAPAASPARPARPAQAVSPARLPHASADAVRQAFARVHCAAEPVDPTDPTSPWLTAPSEVLAPLRKVLGPSPYRARVGVTTGGANAVFWLEVLEPLGDGLVRVRNLVSGARRKVPEITAPLEAELLYPLLRGRDVARFHAVPSAHLLLPHSLAGDRPALSAFPEAELAARWPHAHAYLKRFESMLRGRALYRRYFTRRRKGGYVETGPYYSLFDLGPYSAAPYKAVWHRMVTPVGAVVVSPLEERPVLPQEVHTFVGSDSLQEAAYLVGLINASPFGLAALAYAQAGSKGFAAPHLLRHLRLPRFDPDNPAHQELGRRALGMQERWAEASPAQRQEAQARLDQAAAPVWGLDDQEMETLRIAYQALTPHSW